MNHQALTLIIIIFRLSLVPLQAQMTGELKQFLWQKNFSDIIENYSEEKITLHDEGLWQKQLSQRSFQEVSGWRVQLFAGSTEENARAAAAEVQSLALDSVYVLEQDEFFKVQLGNFRERLDAEKMLDQLRYEGISNAWIVQTIIHIPKDTTGQSLVTDSKSDSLYYSPLMYTIQIFVTTDAAIAEKVLQSVKNRIEQEGWVIRSGDFWKVVVGNFTEETAARQFLNVLRDSGYPDAWLTQVNSSKE